MFAAFKASAPVPAKPQATSNVEPVAAGEFSEKWSTVLSGLKDSSPGVHGILSQGRLIGVEDGCAVIEVNPQVESLIRSFDRNGKKEMIRGKIAETFGPGVGVKFRISEGADTFAPPTRSSPPSSPGTASPNAESGGAPPARSNPQNFVRPQPEAPPQLPPPARITPEQIDAAKQDPLVRAVLEQFGGTIVKVET
ncbi:hypothetical protein BH10PLA1_BH10PLA1_18250 [soil metagenome]